MKTILLPLLATLSSLLRSRAVLHLEILALRHQLAMVAHKDRKLRFRRRERLCWIWLYRIWPDCLETLAIFKADTLVRWHRRGFRFYWTRRVARRRDICQVHPAAARDFAGRPFFGRDAPRSGIAGFVTMRLRHDPYDEWLYGIRDAFAYGLCRLRD